MQKLLKTCLAISFLLAHAPAAVALDITQPTEIGTTTMTPGEYVLVDKASSKTFNLMITSKGNMIVSPGTSAVTIGPTTTPAAATGAPAAPAAQTPATGAAAPAANASNAMLKGLMQKGMSEGLNQLKKTGAQNQLQNLLK